MVTTTFILKFYQLNIASEVGQTKECTNLCHCLFLRNKLEILSMSVLQIGITGVSNNAIQHSSLRPAGNIVLSLYMCPFVITQSKAYLIFSPRH